MKKYVMNFTKYFVSILMVLSLVLSVNPISSMAYSPRADIGDVEVQVDSEGKLSVTGGGMDTTDSSSAING